MLGPSEVILAGLASDGGLYLPESWPQISAADLGGLSGLSYADLCARILAPFLEDFMSEAELSAICHDVYADFDHPEVAPLRALGEGLWLLELFHGPTLAFKDFALGLLARFLEQIAGTNEKPVLLIGATSGDTCAAAVHAFQGLRNSCCTPRVEYQICNADR